MAGECVDVYNLFWNVHQDFPSVFRTAGLLFYQHTRADGGNSEFFTRNKSMNTHADECEISLQIVRFSHDLLCKVQLRKHVGRHCGNWRS